jgi:hypothetical protein
MTIRDIDVPFWRIVLILVKWSIAAIPAMIILTLLVSFLGALMAEVLGLFGPRLFENAGLAALALSPSARDQRPRRVS